MMIVKDATPAAYTAINGRMVQFELTFMAACGDDAAIIATPYFWRKGKKTVASMPVVIKSFDAWYDTLADILGYIIDLTPEIICNDIRAALNGHAFGDSVITSSWYEVDDILREAENTLYRVLTASNRWLGSDVRVYEIAEIHGML